MSVDIHVLRNSLLDVHQADVGSQSADTIKLNFNPCVLRGTRVPHQSYLTNREVVSAWGGDHKWGPAVLSSDYPGISQRRALAKKSSLSIAFCNNYTSTRWKP
jgi:hypothetical protein